MLISLNPSPHPEAIFEHLFYQIENRGSKSLPSERQAQASLALCDACPVSWLHLNPTCVHRGIAAVGFQVRSPGTEMWSLVLLLPLQGVLGTTLPLLRPYGNHNASLFS